MSTPHVTVLGAGLSGLAAAQKARALGSPVTVYEADAFTGGHAASLTHQTPHGAWVFDNGPHISFTKESVIRDLFAEGVSGQFGEYEARVSNYWQGHWVAHPAQCHLSAVPGDVAARCLLDFIEARREEKPLPENYADWCLQGLGKTFSERFTFPYTRKYWTAEPTQMTTDWVGGRVKAPSLEEVVNGALGVPQTGQHYITSFRYPLHGGFGTYAQSLGSDANVQLGKRVADIDLKRRRLQFEDGSEAFWEALISSLPLPELIRRVQNVPSEVREAVEQLVCTSVVLVDIGLAQNDHLPNAHWLYVYDEDLLPARVHFPHKLSPNNAPAGCGSIQAEVYHSPYRPLLVADVLTRTVEDLGRMGLISAGNEILFARARPIRYANVLFDHSRTAALTIVRRFLREQNVLCCGRFGEWEYLWSDGAILSGWRAGESAASIK